jgi:hypothetical protein
MNLSLILQGLIALAPLVTSAVETAEKVFGPTKGAAKLKDAVARVEGALPDVAELAGNVDAARAAIQPMVEAAVSAANAAGVFRTSKRKSKKRAR